LQKIDVAVIGGGVGSAIAYYLALKGIDVVLLEKEAFLGRTTRACAGAVRAQFSDPTSIMVGKESIKILADFQKKEDIKFTQGGYLLLAHSSELAKSFKENIKLQRSFGLEVEEVTSLDINKMIPGLPASEYLLATFCPFDGQANPFLVLDFYRRNILNYGGKIWFKSEVTRLFRDGGHFIIEINQKQRIKAEVVVNAGGPWAREIAKMVGIEVPSYPERHEIIVTERVAPLFEPMIVEFSDENGCYLQQKLDGSFVICASLPTVPNKINFTPSFKFIQEIRRRATRLVPVLGYLTIVRHWAGHYIMTPDGKPIVGATPLPGFYLAVGLCGHGFMFSPMLGKLMAELITTGRTSLDISSWIFKRDYSIPEILK